ncbi:hypothetical protein [Thermoplasma sp. Kam2015]|uniref:hypothetical protein n=1 Tax=Thermoplasma sp. Kam2015 TaxID=2094122 RepID=UPI001293DED6|nr:hypothetical protein [Thermoplasma sp. Kam2015]
MPGIRGSPSKKYPQISVTKDLYDRLRELKFELKVDSLGEVIKLLIEEHDSASRKSK